MTTPRAPRYQLRVQLSPSSTPTYLPPIYDSEAAAVRHAKSLINSKSYGCVDIMRVRGDRQPEFDSPAKHYTTTEFLAQVPFDPTRRVRVR